MAAIRISVATVAAYVGLSIFGFSAHAADFTGGWATDASKCAKIFVKSGGKISFTDDSEIYGSGLIVDANIIRGKIATCAIKSRKEVGAITHFILECSTDIAFQTVQFSVRIDGDNKITRLFPGLPELSTSYFRCPL